MDEADLILDAAIADHPLEPLPPGFVRRTMARVAASRGYTVTMVDLAVASALGVTALVSAGLIWYALGSDPVLDRAAVLQMMLQELSMVNDTSTLTLGALALSCVVLAVALPTAVLATERRALRPS